MVILRKYISFFFNDLKCQKDLKLTKHVFVLTNIEYLLFTFSCIVVHHTSLNFYVKFSYICWPM